MTTSSATRKTRAVRLHRSACRPGLRWCLSIHEIIPLRAGCTRPVRLTGCTAQCRQLDYRFLLAAYLDGHRAASCGSPTPAAAAVRMRDELGAASRPSWTCFERSVCVPCGQGDAQSTAVPLENSEFLNAAFRQSSFCSLKMCKVA